MSLIIGKENTFTTDTIIYENGDDIESVAYVIDGAVRMDTGQTEQIVTAGNFIAVRDLFDGFYRADYYAKEGCRLMVFPAEDIISLTSFLESNPEIHSKYYSAVCSMMLFLYNQYSTLYSEIGNIYKSLKSIHEHYLQCCSDAGIAPSHFMMPHDASLYAFESQSFAQNYTIFLNCYKVPKKLELLYQKNPSNFLRHQLNMINSISTTYEDMVFFLKTIVSLYASKSQDCLFYLVSNLMAQVSAEHSAAVMKLLNEMKNIISGIDESVKTNTGISLDIDYNRVNFYFMMASNAADSKNTESNSGSSDLSENSDISDDAETDINTVENPDEPLDIDSLLEHDEPSAVREDIDFSGNLFRLCEYGHMPDEFFDKFNMQIEKYMELPDKNSRDDESRVLRRDITNMYFMLYEAIFLQYITDAAPPYQVQLFLDFGVLDERLLSSEQLNYIANIPPLMKTEPCMVYRMTDWLKAIYNGDKMPSKNEFDKDYVEFIRDKKREEHLTPEQERALLEDNIAKVKYEINNLLKYNCRILSGNMLSFTPMLSSFDFDGDLDKYELTSKSINDAMNDVLAIDYSAFYREQMYADPEKKIEKEVIQLQVFPDIILFPVYGINTVMWQDLSGKRSNTQGRFLFPSFYRGNLNDAMITIIGRFRWELCKSVMGTAWNNVIIPSLTAEYSDYIQFYRKNRDLSAEKKESLKNQIARCRNNTREVFISDYILWIKYESNGSIRLNKVARQILATYCPFSKELRAKIANQPIYEEAMRKFNITHQKKAHEMVTRLRALERNGAEITQVIYDTQKFYDM